MSNLEIKQIVERARTANKNILILGAPRSGTHALASVIHQFDSTLEYLGEQGQHRNSEAPWQDFDLFYNNTPRKLAHIVQSYSKIFAMTKTAKIKEHTLIVELRRRDKIKQFASWEYFKHIGTIYNFQHSGQDYVEPGSITVTHADIELFVIDQVLDSAFDPDYTVYYEDLELDHSKIKKNQYAYPIEQVFGNIELVEEFLGDWKYNTK